MIGSLRRKPLCSRCVSTSKWPRWTASGSGTARRPLERPERYCITSLNISGVMMLPLYAWERVTKRPERPPQAGSLPHIVQLLLLGLLGVTLNQFFFIVGLSRTSVAHAAILIGLTPIQVLIIAGLRGQERITARKAS